MQESEKFRAAGCDVPTKPASTNGSRARGETIRAIARRVAGHEAELAGRVVARCREEILDYRTGGDSLVADATGLALDSVEALLANLERGEPLSSAQLERTRMGAARRVHQGVSLESFLHATRLWGEVAWETLRAAVRGDDADEVEAALEIASRVMRHVDLTSTAGAQAYLHEAQGSSTSGRVLRRDLLEALLSGEGDSTTARRLAGSLGVKLAENYVVLLVRPREAPARARDGQPLGTRVNVSQVVELARTHLRPPGGALLVGVRDAEVVALYPVCDPGQVHTAKDDAGSLAGAVASSRLSVGMSGWHPGFAGIAVAYAEAKDAAEIAAGSGWAGRAVTLDEVLIEHIARFTPHVARVLDETLRPLVDYDLAHGTALLATVRAYVDERLNLTRSAETLHVHPNTVMYRLRRVRELSGRDPHDPDDLLILSLALKLSEVRAAAYADSP